jgi:hypothetical protein
MIYQQPKGARLVEESDKRPVKIESRILFTQIIGPIAEALTDWESRGLCHGAVRPENLFMPATSTDRRNTGTKSFCWRFKPQRFS